MGGNALKTVETRRYNKDEFFELYKEIREKLGLARTNCYIQLLPSYKNKETFGDMDILINRKYFNKDVNQIKSVFKPTEVYNNGDVVSFDYKELQIDFIYVEDRYFNTSLTYYSYNDLGNLMGRIANKMGVKYGHKGLIKKVYSEDGSKVLDEILLSTDINVIFQFLGFNPYKYYYGGFNDLEDIFHFVIDSEFFNKELFAYENLDHQNRTRNRKRKTYQQFLDYIKDLDTDDFIYPEDRDYWLNRINKYFPEVKILDKIEQLKLKEHFKQLVKEKFNGDIVKEITGLDGKLLGMFIDEFKKQFSDFDYFILNTDFDYIKELIKKSFNNKIIENVLEELNESLDSINGPMVREKDVVKVDLEKNEIIIKFDINKVNEDSYIGICFY